MFPPRYSPFILLCVATLAFGQEGAILPPTDNQNADATDTSFHWKNALLESLFGATIAHAERFKNEQGTRDAISGPFIRDYFRDIQNFHGWQDGDGILTSYVAHPMEGSFAGFVERQNDPRYASVEFGSSQRYWTSVMRSLAFSTAYNIQWSMGPYSEASLGNVEIHASPGLVDLVGSSTMGLFWMIGEDMVDRYLIKRIEYRYRNVFIRAFARSMLNPTRSYSNLLRLKKPWRRDSRPDLYEYVSNGEYRSRDDLTGPKFDPLAWPPKSAFELTAEPMFERYLGSRGSSCVGGAGEGALRLSKNSSIVFRIDGCQLFGFPTNYSGDTLNYMAGPRFNVATGGRWNAHVQVLGGGTKITHDYTNTALRDKLVSQASAEGKTRPESDNWVTEFDTNGFTLVTSGVVAYQLNSLMQLRVADLSYQRSWVSELQGMNYDNGLRFSFGLTCRFGVWER